MRRPFSGLLLLLGFGVTGIALAADQGETLAQAREAGQAELRVLWVASEGWAGPDEQGQLTGVTIEIMHHFADWVQKQHDIELDLDFVEVEDWSRFYQRVRDGHGGLFGLGNVTITEARREELAFSPAYVTNVAVLITHQDIPSLNVPADIGKTFVNLAAMAFEGTLHETRLRELADTHWPEMPIELAGSNDEIIAATAAGSHFAYIDAYNYYRAREQGAPLKRHSALDDPGEEFGIIMPLDNDWQPLLTEFFAADGGLLNSAWYRELMANHLGSEIAAVLLD